MPVFRRRVRRLACHGPRPMAALIRTRQRYRRMVRISRSSSSTTARENTRQRLRPSLTDAVAINEIVQHRQHGVLAQRPRLRQRPSLVSAFLIVRSSWGGGCSRRPASGGLERSAAGRPRRPRGLKPRLAGGVPPRRHRRHFGSGSSSSSAAQSTHTTPQCPPQAVKLALCVQIIQLFGPFRAATGPQT